MGLKSTKSGENGEIRLRDMFAERGYWCHLIQRNRSGSQPFDLVAVTTCADRNDVWFVDSKVVLSGNVFPFERIEPNQWEAMEFASKRAEGANMGFFVFFGQPSECHPHFASYRKVVELKSEGHKSISKDDMKPWGGS